MDYAIRVTSSSRRNATAFPHVSASANACPQYVKTSKKRFSSIIKNDDAKAVLLKAYNPPTNQAFTPRISQVPKTRAFFHLVPSFFMPTYELKHNKILSADSSVDKRNLRA